MPDDKMVQTAINTIRTLSIDAVQAVDADYEKLGQSAVTLDDFRVVRDGIVGGHRVTTGRQVPFCMFTDPEFARIGLSETEACQRGIAYRLAKIPMATVLRAQTLSETRGFMKALIDTASDRILGFTVFGVGAGEIMGTVQVAMIAGLPYTALRDAIFTHPTLVEGLIPLFSTVPAMSASVVRDQCITVEKTLSIVN